MPPSGAVRCGAETRQGPSRPQSAHGEEMSGGVGRAHPVPPPASTRAAINNDCPLRPTNTARSPRNEPGDLGQDGAWWWWWLWWWLWWVWWLWFGRGAYDMCLSICHGDAYDRMGVTEHLRVRLPTSPPPHEPLTTNNCWPSRAPKKSALNVRVDGERKMQ